MKIRIDFNNEERDELLATFSKERIKKDIPNYYMATGKFGSITSDIKQNYVEINLSTKFIAAFTNIIAFFWNSIEMLVATIGDFGEDWFSDVKTTNSLKKAITRVNQTKEED